MLFKSDALKGYTYLVCGVANDRSLAYHIAEALHRLGANLVLISQPGAIEKRAKPIAEALGASLYFCDVTDDAMLDDVFEKLELHAPFHGFVHSIAFSDKSELRGRFIETSRLNFQKTLDISCYSFVDIARRMEHLMPDGGSGITLSFAAATGPMPHYNVMGIAKAALEAATKYLAFDMGEHMIRINAISASPEDTMAARGISDFRLIGDFAEAQSPLGRRATVEEIADMAVFLLSPLSSGTTGQIIYVDCGSSVPIMCPARNAERMSVAMSEIAQTYNSKKGDGR